MGKPTEFESSQKPCRKNFSATQQNKVFIMMFLSRRNPRTGSTEPSSNKSVGVKTKRSMRYFPQRLGTILIMLLATAKLVRATVTGQYVADCTDLRILVGMKTIGFPLH